jgi:hypothetical protein
MWCIHLNKNNNNQHLWWEAFSECLDNFLSQNSTSFSILHCTLPNLIMHYTNQFHDFPHRSVVHIFFYSFRKRVFTALVTMKTCWQNAFQNFVYHPLIFTALIPPCRPQTSKRWKLRIFDRFIILFTLIRNGTFNEKLDWLEKKVWIKYKAWFLRRVSSVFEHYKVPVPTYRTHLHSTSSTLSVETRLIHVKIHVI